MLPITACVACYNEESRLPELFAHLKDVNEILVVDHLSTDKTSEVAAQLGARVVRKPNFTEEATQADVDEFKRRYGFLPSFKARDCILNGEKDMNDMFPMAKNDWIIYIDADEILSWDPSEVSELMKNNDLISCLFIHNRNPDSTPNESFPCTKLFRKDRVWFRGEIHGAVIGFNLRVAYAKKMVINHYQVERTYRSTYLPVLEYYYFKTQGTKMNWYLAREYYNRFQRDHCIQFFKMFLNCDGTPIDRSVAYIMMASCEWEVGRDDKAYEYIFQAMKLAPHSPDPFIAIAKMSTRGKSKVWNRIAEFVKKEITPDPALDKDD